jgi:FkbM family methyltransferase
MLGKIIQREIAKIIAGSGRPGSPSATPATAPHAADEPATRTARQFNTLAECRHGPMLFNRHDKYIARALELYGEYMQKEVELFAQLIGPGDTVVDAGANLGAHSLYFSIRVGDAGRIYAFEPQRVVFQTLCANLALNSALNAFAFQAALGESPGEIVVDVPDYTQENNFGGMSLGEWQSGERVPVMTIDALALERCDFIKIDVEGMEQAVIGGARSTLERLAPTLYVENDRREHAQALVDLLKSLGYALFWHLPPYYNPDNFNGIAENVFGDIMSRNMLCVPVGHPLPSAAAGLAAI